jgi:hypothetical protein
MLSEAWLELTGVDLGCETAKHAALEARLVPDVLVQVPEPVSPCIVLMLCATVVPHAGLFRNGRVLHIRQDGARNERLEDATRGFSEVRYYAKRHPDPRPAGPA